MTQYGDPFYVRVTGQDDGAVIVYCEDSDECLHDFRVPYEHVATQNGLNLVFKFDETEYAFDEGDDTVIECPEEIKEYILSDEVLRKINNRTTF